jgi:putative membrane protein
VFSIKSDGGPHENDDSPSQRYQRRCGIAQSVGEKTGVNSAFGITKTGFHQGSCHERHARDRSAKIAQQKAPPRKEIRGADDYWPYQDKQRAEGDGPTELTPAIPKSLDHSSQKMLDKLRNAKPEEFASDYDPMQVSAHKDAVSLFERYAKGGDSAKLFGLAKRYLHCSTICRWPNRWTRTASEWVSRESWQLAGGLSRRTESRPA